MRSARLCPPTHYYTRGNHSLVRADRALLAVGLVIACTYWLSAQVNPAVNVEVLYAFPYSNTGSHGPMGSNPEGNVIEIPGMPGVFVTTASTAGDDPTCPFTFCSGTLVKIDTNIPDPTQRATVLHYFAGKDAVPPDGSLPQGNLVFLNGKIYGVTRTGGQFDTGGGGGTVYSIDANNPLSSYSRIHEFNFSDGVNPTGLTIGKDANGATVLYGTTQNGGAFPCGLGPSTGTLFRIDFPGGVPTFTPLNCFSGSIDGGLTNIAFPNLPIQASDMKLYGSSKSRELWTIDPGNVGPGIPATPFAAFTSDPSAQPWGRLVEGPDGVLYGTTRGGGTNGWGSAFRADKPPASPNLTTLYSFTGGTDGSLPLAGMVVGSDGTLYGTTSLGGDQTFPSGTLFRLTPGSGGALASLYSFNGLADGYSPQGELTEASDGLIYGTLSALGTNGTGTVFRFGKAGVPAWIHQIGNTAVWSIATDLAGRTYVFGGTDVSLGGAGSGTYFIGRFKSDGTLDPTFGGINGFVQFGPTASAGNLSRIIVDPHGNSYVSGSTDQNVFGFTNHGGTDVFVASFDVFGNLRWGYMFGSPQFDTAQDLSVDPSQNVYVTGYTLGNLGGTLQGLQDGFVSVLTSSLQLTTFQWGITGQYRYANGLAYCADSQGATRLYVGGTDQNPPNLNGWISWFNSASITSGPQQTRTVSDGDFVRIITDSQCDPYATGSLVDSPSSSRFIIQKYDPLLANPASLEIDGPSEGALLGVGTNSIVLDGLNNIYVAGTAGGPQNLFGNSITGILSDWYGVYDSTGTKQLRSGVIDAGPASQTIAGTIALDPIGNINVGGWSDKALPGSQSAGGFLAQYLPVTAVSGPYPTITTVTSSQGSITHCQSVTFTATVAGASATPSGIVHLLIDAVESGTATLDANGQAQFPSSILDTGSHAVTVQYDGDATYAASISQSIAETVTKQKTSTLLQAVPNPSIVGQKVTIMVRVNFGACTAPLGEQVIITIGTQSALKNLVNGTVQVKKTFTQAGSFPVKAQYPGDSNFTGSQRQITQVVQ